jgi:uncharacterized protein YcfJ
MGRIIQLFIFVLFLNGCSTTSGGIIGAVIGSAAGHALAKGDEKKEKAYTAVGALVGGTTGAMIGSFFSDMNETDRLNYNSALIQNKKSSWTNVDGVSFTVDPSMEITHSSNSTRVRCISHRVIKVKSGIIDTTGIMEDCFNQSGQKVPKPN